MALAFLFLFPALVNYYSPPFFLKKEGSGCPESLRACLAPGSSSCPWSLLEMQKINLATIVAPSLVLHIYSSSRSIILRWSAWQIKPRHGDSAVKELGDQLSRPFCGCHDCTVQTSLFNLIITSHMRHTPRRQCLASCVDPKNDSNTVRWPSQFSVRRIK